MSQIKLGIISAMTSEIEGLIGHLTQTTTTERGHLLLADGMLGTCPVVAVRCGVGKVNAALATQMLIDTCGVTHVVNSGVAGGLDTRLKVGDYVVASYTTYHDFSCEPLVAKNYIPEMGLATFSCDRALRQVFEQAARSVDPTMGLFEGPISSGDQFITSVEARERIVSETDALACEMEGAAVGHVAVSNGVPYVTVRCISDQVGITSYQHDYAQFEAKAAARSVEILKTLAHLDLEHVLA